MPLDHESAGKGVPVLAVHPFPFDHDVYRPQLRAAAAGELPCALVAVKLPGFGGSLWPPDHPPVLRVEDLAAELVALTSALGLERPILLGTGLGGYVVLQTLSAAPGSCRAGIVIGCKPAPDSSEQRPARAQAARVALESSVAAADMLAVASLSPIRRAACEEEARAMVLRADGRALSAAVWGIHLRPDPVPGVTRVDVPLVAAVGADDPVCSPAEARALADLAPDGRFRLLEGCGHGAPLERPDAVTELIAELLPDVSG